jgi:hypothetical protein
MHIFDICSNNNATCTTVVYGVSGVELEQWLRMAPLMGLADVVTAGTTSVSSSLMLLLILPSSLRPARGLAPEFFVRPDGDDGGPGSAARPFKSLGRCAKAMAAASVAASCQVGGGTYRETVLLPPQSAHALAFRAVGGSRPVLSGLDVLEGLRWRRSELPAARAGQPSAQDSSRSRSRSRLSPCAFVAELPVGAPSGFQQLFYGGQMMVEARWPNLDVGSLEDEMLSRSKVWEPVAPGSKYGRIEDPALARGGFSWNGALATLQVAHQFFTWTRAVSNHTGGGSSFQYARDLPGLAEWSEPKQCWGTTEENVRLDGSGILRTSTATYTQCSGLCTEHDDCHNWTYACPPPDHAVGQPVSSTQTTVAAVDCSLPQACVAGVASTVGWLTTHQASYSCGEIWEQAIKQNCGPKSVHHRCPASAATGSFLSPAWKECAPTARAIAHEQTNATICAPPARLPPAPAPPRTWCSNGACTLHTAGAAQVKDTACISGPRSHTCSQDWSKNQYFLSGKLEALDSPGEWFEEKRNGSRRLHFFPPVKSTCRAPDKLLEVKVRDYAFEQPPAACKNGSHLSLTLSGLSLRGASFRLGCCHGCTLSDLALEYHLRVTSIQTEILT